jgi:cell division protein FtsQ
MLRVAAVLLGLLAATVVVALAWQMDRPIENVRITGGLTPGEQQQIKAAVLTGVDAGLLSVDLAEVRDRLRSLSWTRRVTVRRVWPPGLDIAVDKDVPVAVWGDGAHLTSNGRVMAIPDAPAALPVFECALASPRKALEVYLLLQESLPGAETRISALKQTSLGEWEVELRGGLRVALGDRDLAERIARFGIVYERALKDRIDTVDYVDARYTSGLAVGWKEPLLAYEEITANGI